MTISKILQETADNAGKTLLSYFRKNLIPKEKKSSHQNLVTEADLASQKIIKELIIKLMVKNGVSEHDIGFIGEENLIKKGIHQFIIDPLDGTNNFASGHDYFCISIGYVYKGVLTAGIIYHPTIDTMYIAEKDKGAHKVIGGKTVPMKIAYTLVKDSILLSYMSSRESTRRYWLPKVTKLHSATRGLRILGSCALDCMHFSDKINNINIVLNAHAYLWDIAAAILIVSEAGGVMTNWKGVPVHLAFNDPQQAYEVLVCHPKNLASIVNIIQS